MSNRSEFRRSEPASQPVDPCCIAFGYVLDYGSRVAFGAGSGYLGALVLTSINPVTGAIFGGIFGIIQSAVELTFKALGKPVGDGALVFTWIASVIVATAATIGTMFLTGNPLTLAAAAVLTLATIVAMKVVEYTFRCCSCGIFVALSAN